jgi:hypothetical protein
VLGDRRQGWVEDCMKVLVAPEQRIANVVGRRVGERDDPIPI